jgi:thiol-disulfide isomerase/thioredoxin
MNGGGKGQSRKLKQGKQQRRSKRICKRMCNQMCNKVSKIHRAPKKQANKPAVLSDKPVSTEEPAKQEENPINTEEVSVSKEESPVNTTVSTAETSKPEEAPDNTAETPVIPAETPVSTAETPKQEESQPDASEKPNEVRTAEENAVPFKETEPKSEESNNNNNKEQKTGGIMATIQNFLTGTGNKPEEKKPDQTGGKKSKKNNKKSKKSNKKSKKQHKKHNLLVVGLIHSDTCGHCIAMRPAWDQMKESLRNTLGNRVLVHEVEASQMPNGLNALRKYTVQKVQIQGGYPTLYKITGGNVLYYNGPRDHDSMYNWYASHRK